LCGARLCRAAAGGRVTDSLIRGIRIKGERPDEVPNPASTLQFLAQHPTVFAPLQSETFARVKAKRHLALVAPTSSGKTLAIAAPLFELKRKVAFVYPYRARDFDNVKVTHP